MNQSKIDSFSPSLFLKANNHKNNVVYIYVVNHVCLVIIITPIDAIETRRNSSISSFICRIFLKLSKAELYTIKEICDFGDTFEKG